MSIESVTPSNHLILCRPLLFLPAYKWTYTIQTCVVQSSLSVLPYQNASVLSIGLCLTHGYILSVFAPDLTHSKHAVNRWWKKEDIAKKNKQNTILLYILKKLICNNRLLKHPRIHEGF